eukprot:jgi/Galph1/3830/GphlegSOOS_G2502.1
MPALSSTMTEGKIVKWLKKVGDKGDIVMVVESDKADMDVEAFDPGYLAAVLVDEGGTAPVGKTVGLVAEKAEDIELVRQCGLDCIDSGSSSRHDGTTTLETVEFLNVPSAGQQTKETRSDSIVEKSAQKAPSNIPVIMPTLSSTMTEGKIVAWHKKEGDFVKKGDIIMVVESDKADMDVESFDEGYLAHIEYPQDAVCPIGTTVAYLVPHEADIRSLKEWVTTSLGPMETSVKDTPKKSKQDQSSSIETIPVSQPPPCGSERMPASPYARKLAAENNVSLSNLRGSGEGGRIVAKDVLQAKQSASMASGKTYATPQAKKLAESFGISLDAIKKGSGPFGRIVPADIYNAAGKQPTADEHSEPVNLVDFSTKEAKPSGSSSVSTSSSISSAPSASSHATRGKSDGSTSPMEGEVVMNSMQKAVVNNMNTSLQVPVFRVSYTVNMDALEALYKKISDKGVSMSTLLAKAVAIVLRNHPIINASYGKYSIHYHRDIHVAMAVALPDGGNTNLLINMDNGTLMEIWLGLITPVLKNTDQEDIYTLSNKWRDLVKRALTKKLNPEEYSSGTFFISNLGMFGVQHFDAILPPGAGAILAVGASKPVVRMQPNGLIGVTKEMQMTITCDHRHIYGAQAAMFLKDLCSLLEDKCHDLTL